MRKHSVVLSGHATSFSLEDAFWAELKSIAQEKNCTVVSLLEKIDNIHTGNLSSAIRLYVLDTLKQKIIQDK